MTAVRPDSLETMAPYKFITYLPTYLNPALAGFEKKPNLVQL